jgi:hypothetical protein
MSVHGRFFALACMWHRRTLSLLASESLVEGEGKRVRSHLAGCVACRKRFAELQAVAELGRYMGTVIASGEEVGGRYRAWEWRIREEAMGETRGAARRPGRPGWAWGGLTAAWLVIGVLRWSAPAVSPTQVRSTPISWGQVRMVLGLVGPRGETQREQASPSKQPSQTPWRTAPDPDRGAALDPDGTRRLG